MSFDELFTLLDEISKVLNQTELTLESVMEILGMIAAFWETVLWAVGVIGGIISAIISLLITLVNVIVKAIPVYKLAKKKGRKKAWMVWIPVWTKYFRWYVMMDMAGDKPFEIFKGKISIQDRRITFWTRVLIVLFGGKLVTAIGVVLGFIPYVGTLFSMVAGVLYVALEVVCAMIRFVYLRDVLDLFDPKKKQNRIAAIVIAALDSLATLGFAEAIWLYLIMKKEPLPEEPVVVQAIEEATT